MSQVARTSFINLEWPTLLERLAERTQTQAGRERAADIPLDLSRSAVERSLAEIDEARALLAEGFLPGLAGLTDLTAELGRAEKGAALEGDELRRIFDLEQVIAELREVIAGSAAEAGALKSRCDGLSVDRDFLSILRRSVGEDGTLLDSASPVLLSLRRDVRSRAEGIRARIQEILDTSPFTSFLQDDFYTLRENRYVIPLKMGAQAQIDGIVHDTSNTGQTVFLEPREIVDANNRLKLAEQELVAEEFRIRKDLTDRVRGRASRIRANAAFLIDFDILLAKARLCDAMGAATPEITSDGSLRLKELVHPLLRLAGERVVANDLEIPQHCRCVVISGPNAGGKTVLLKAVGLAALMLKAGLPPPAAAGSALPLFENVFADVGDAQSLAEHLSSFTGHLRQIRAMCEAAAPGTLLLLDEIMSGTAPTEGAALARAVLEFIEKRGALGFASTHYEEIKDIPAENGRRLSLSMATDPGTLRPTYRVQPGPAARSLAFEAAKEAGLPEEILGGARKHLSPQRREEQTRLERIEAEARKVESLRTEIEHERDELLKERTRYEKKLAQLRERDKSALQTEAQALREELSRARASLRLHRRRLRTGEADEAAKDLDQSLEKARDLAQKAAEEIGTAEPQTPVDWESACVGDPILLAGTTQQGRILELPDAKGRVRIEVGGNRMLVDRSRLAAGEEKRPTQVLTAAGIVYETPSEGAFTTLDLRGMREEEALKAVTFFLDRATLANLSEVTLIHGHGEGILKRAVRDLLARSEYAASFRPGERGEGGDGVTVVTLR